MATLQQSAMQRPQIGESSNWQTFDTSFRFFVFLVFSPLSYAPRAPASSTAVFSCSDMFERVYFSLLPFSRAITTFDRWRKLVHPKFFFFFLQESVELCAHFSIVHFEGKFQGRGNATVEENLAKASWTVIFLRLICVKDCHLRSMKGEVNGTQGKLDFPNIRWGFFGCLRLARRCKRWTDFSEKWNAKKPKGAN